MRNTNIFQTNNIQEKLHFWQHVILKRDTAQSKQILLELEDQNIHSISSDQLYGYYYLLKYGHHILVHEFDEANRCFVELEDYHPSFNTEEMFFFYFFQGIKCKISSESYQEALAFYRQAEQLVPSIIQDAPVAELSYQIATVLFELIKSFESLGYVQKAYALFQKLGDYVRMWGCQILIGLNCIDIHQYKEAERRFHLALKEADKTKDISLKKKTYHDLGLLYSKQSLPKAAVRWLLEANKIGELSYKTPILLCQEYCKLNQIDEAKKWYDTALPLYEKLDNQPNIMRLKLLHVIYIDSQKKDFELILRQGMAYFEKHGYWEYILDFAPFLTKFLYEHDRYQESIKYYELIIASQQKIYVSEALN